MAFGRYQYANIEYLVQQAENETERRIFDSCTHLSQPGGPVILKPRFVIDGVTDSPSLIFQTKKETVIIDARESSKIDYTKIGKNRKLHYVQWKLARNPRFPLGMIDYREVIAPNLYYLLRRNCLEANYNHEHLIAYPSMSADFKTFGLEFCLTYSDEEKFRIKAKINPDKTIEINDLIVGSYI